MTSASKAELHSMSWLMWLDPLSKKRCHELAVHDDAARVNYPVLGELTMFTACLPKHLVAASSWKGGGLAHNLLTSGFTVALLLSLQLLCADYHSHCHLGW